MACRLFHFVFLLGLLLLPGVHVSAQSVPPQLTSVSIASSRGSGLYATTGDTITLTFAADQLLQTADVLILGKPANTSGAGLQWTATIPVSDDDPSGPVGFFISYSNPEGDPGVPVSTTTNGSQVTIDRNFPEITSGPENVTASAGGSFSLSIEVSSSSPFSCQWRRDQVPIHLATETTLTRTNIQTTDSGYYDVVVTNLVGEAIGGPVLVQVFGGAPAIVTQPAPRSVAAGASATFAVSATGAHALSYQWRKAGKAIVGATHPTFTIASSQKADAAAYSVVVSNSLGSVTSDAVALTVVAANVTGLPLIDPQPVSALAAVGDDTGFYAPANGAPTLVFEWRKNGTKIKGAPTSNSYGFTASLANAGIYSVLVKNAAGSVMSAGARLAVVDTAPSPDIIAAQGDTMTLKAVTAGAGLLFQWQKEGEDIQDETVSTLRSIKGTQTATLTIKGAMVADRGEYRCIVRLGNRTLPTSIKGVRVYNAGPQIQLADGTVLRGGIVGGTYTGDPIPILEGENNLPATYSASPLPPGLKMNPLTGIISGKPTKPSAAGKPFEFTIRVANKFGSPTVKVKMEILPLPPFALGSFTGFVRNDSAVNGNLGGRFTLTTTSSGGFSGSFTLGAKSHPITGGVLEVPFTGDATATLFIKSAGLSLSFNIDDESSEISGMLDNEIVEPPPSIRACKMVAPPNAVTINHTAQIFITPGQGLAPEGTEGFPQGYGFLTLSMSKTGVATWGGRLPDGSSITGGGSYCRNGNLPLHLLLYSGTGSVQGEMKIAGDNLDGYLSWIKRDQGPKSTARSYKEGFPLFDLTVTGGVYVPPATGQIIGLPPDCVVYFYDGFLGGFNFFQLLTLSTANKVQITSSTNQAKVTSLIPASGLFAGTFGITQPDLLDTTEPIGSVTRPGTFSGVFVQRLSKGFGHYLLPERPDQAGEKVTSTAVLSGTVTWEAYTD